MRTTLIPTPGLGRLLNALTMIILLAAGPARAAVTAYTAALAGANESPPNASPAVGIAQVELDDVADTMHLTVVFSGLQGVTTSAHIHAATALPGQGNVGVATTTPTFSGFPAGVTSGSYEVTLDMTQLSSYNPSFVAASGGTAAAAEAALFQSIAEGRAYFNLHTTVFGGGEIRGFFVADSVPDVGATWGGIKTLYR